MQQNTLDMLDAQFVDQTRWEHSGCEGTSEDSTEL